MVLVRGESRKLEHGFGMISAGTLSALPEGHEENDVPFLASIIRRHDI